MSPLILKRLLDQDIVKLLSVEEFKNNDHALYTAGSPAGFFTLIVEGCVQVIIGSDGMEFQSRSFSYFGAQALLNVLENSQAEYIPDYTVRPTMDCLVVIITQRQYIAARNATLFGMEKMGGGEGGASDDDRDDGDKSNGTFDKVDSHKRMDVFDQEWEIAETHDIESSLTSKSGLNSIARLFKKKSYSRQSSKSDRRALLTLSSTESEAGSSDSSGGGRGDHALVEVAIEEEGDLTLDSVSVPLVNIDSGGGEANGRGSEKFRTMTGDAPRVENYSSSPPRSYHTTQV